MALKRGYQLVWSRNVKMAASRVIGATRLGKKLFLRSALRTGFLSSRAGKQIFIHFYSNVPAMMLSNDFWCFHKASSVLVLNIGGVKCFDRGWEGIKGPWANGPFS